MSVTKIDVRTTCNIPPSTAYLLIAENFSNENSCPIINNKKITPNSDILVIILVESMNCPKIIPVKNSPIIEGSFNLLNNNRITTEVISIIDIFSNMYKSIFNFPITYNIIYIK